MCSETSLKTADRQYAYTLVCVSLIITLVMDDCSGTVHPNLSHHFTQTWLNPFNRSQAIMTEDTRVRRSRTRSSHARRRYLYTTLHKIYTLDAVKVFKSLN